MNRYRFMKIASQLLMTIIIIVCVFLLLLNFNIISINSSNLPVVLTLNHEEIGIKVGNTYQLEPNVWPTNVNSGRISWISTDESIASINDTTGYIETHKTGDVIIKAISSLNNLESECLIHVTKDDIVVNKVNFYLDELNLSIGQSHILKYQVSPKNATLHYFNFVSSDTSVLVVNDNGVIKTVGSGSAYVTIKSSLSNTYDTILVNVYDYSDNKFLSTNNMVNNGTYPDLNTYYKTETINLSKSYIELEIDGQSKIEANVLPVNASQKINWRTSNSKVVTVDNKGIITGIGVGSANIIATSIDGKTSICQVVVKNNDDLLANNFINIKEEKIDLKIGDIKELSYDFYLKKNSLKGIKWSSSDDDIATIDDGIITARGSGSCVIKVTSCDDKHSDSILVNVEQVREYIRLKDIMFESNEYRANVNETIVLNPIFNPLNASNKLLSWSSSDEKIATVRNGIVRCLKEGVVTINVSNGEVSASVKIVVSRIDSSLIIIENEKEEIGIVVGKSLYLSSKVIPSNTTDQSIIWRSSDSSIVKVNNVGMITGLKKGKATISAKTMNGKIDSVVVTVY